MNKLIILHGWSTSVDKWDPFQKQLERNGVEHQLLLIPGLTSPLGGVRNLQDYVAWLENQTAKYNKISLLGHSNGGRISVEFIKRNPDKVDKLILIDSAGIVDNRLKIKIKREIFKAFSNLGGKKLDKLNHLKTLVYKITGEMDYDLTDKNLKRLMVNLIENDLSQTFQKIKIPTLIIWGKKDKMTPITDAVKINNLISGSSLVVIDDASHSPQYTHTQKVTKLIADFLNS